MKQTALIVLTFCCLGSSALAQVAPAATGSGAAPITRGLQYAFRYAESAEFRSLQAAIQTSDVSGSVAYMNRNPEKPFQMNYAGGYIWNLSGPDYISGQFHRMYISQGVNFRKWNFTASDDASYLPDAPVGGFSGIPGTGEVIGGQNPTTTPNGQAILTVNTHALSNYALGEVDHALNYATTLTISVDDNVLHFPNSDGIETRGLSAIGDLTRRLNGRTSVYGEYNFQDFWYPGYSVSMKSNIGFAGVRHRLTRNLTVSAAGGPEWITSTVTSLVPNTLSYAANAAMTYTRKLDSFDVHYSRGVNSGSGFLVGGQLEDTSGNFLHQFGPSFSVGLTGGYQRTLAFINNGATNGAYGSAQATWQLGEKLIVFANYSGRGQNTTSTLPGNVLNETDHMVSFGFGFSPKQQRARQ